MRLVGVGAAVMVGSCLILTGQTPESRPADAAIAALAERLDASETLRDRNALLDANPLAVTPELIRACSERGQAFAGKYKQDLALRSFQSALAVAVRLGNQAQLATAYQRVGVTQYRLGHATEALESYRSGLEGAKAASDDKLEAEMLRNIGVAQRAMGNFTEALATDGQSLDIYRRLDDVTGQIRVMNGMGASYARLGALRKSAELFEQCLKLGEASKDKQAISYATDALGNVYSMQGDAALALVYLEKGLALKQDADTDKGILATTYVNLIQAYGLAGRDSDALLAAGHALALSREAGDESSAGYALLNRAGAYRRLHRYQEALADLRASLAIYEKEKTPLEIAGALSATAEVELLLGQDAAALEAAGRAAELSRKIPAPDILWEALQSVGTANLHLQQPVEARAAYLEGIATVDALRKQLAGGEQEGLDFLRNKMNLFYGLMGLDIDSGQTEEALRTAERAKAGLILDVLRAGHAGITKAMTAGEKQREQQLEARLSGLQARKARDPAAVENAVGELTAFRSELYAAHPELKVRRGESEPLSLADSAELLPDGQTALLEFAVTPVATYLFTITRNGGGTSELRVHKISCNQADLARDVDAFRQQLAARSISYRTAGAALYRRLLGPAADTLRGKTLLAIVPDGPLWSLPFQALVLPNGRHVIEDSAVFYAPSLTELLEVTRSRRSAPVRGTTLLAMGDPDLRSQQSALGRLPNAAREVAAIAQLYGQGAVTLTGASASESQWKALAPRHRIIHLATHGNLNSANPLYSYVLLSPGRGEDGLVEAREILDLDLNADLVVLSACETGRGGFHYGEGLVGLSWALMVAGSPSSVVSQWKVDSESTTDLMVAFHRELRRTDQRALAGKAAAFRAASLHLLKDPNYRHPYYWAGFVLIGDGY
ncbi:MAG TPA: CHAT domain-containing tetratricopeptide repeat protein [Bryobacteraceae bacterium]